VKIGVTQSNGSLQLRFEYQGKRKYLSVGLNDTLENRKLAEQKATILEHDLTFDTVDTTWRRYKVKVNRPKRKTQSHPTPKTFLEIWSRYVTYRTPQVADTTVDNQYRNVTNQLIACPHKKLTQAVEVRDWLLQNYTLDSTRRALVQLNACCKWAIKSKLLSENPFEGMAQDIKKKPPPDCRPFTPEETQAILKAFEKSKYFSLVKFLFLTGTRTGEARGIRWKHIAEDHIIITESRSGYKNRETDTKTHKSRKLPCNLQLREFLQGIRPTDTIPNDRLFQVDSLRSFQSGWQKRVERLVEAGKVAEYRSQYHTRHTFATNCLEAGVPVQQVAEWLGDRPETVLKHYAGIINRRLPPEISLGEKSAG
jgi:integrase